MITLTHPQSPRTASIFYLWTLLPSGGYLVTFCSQWLNYATKPANTSAKIWCQAHTACYWQHHSSGSQVPSKLQCPELLKSLSWRIVKSVSNVTKKRCKDWRKPNARLLATPGARKSAPWLSDTLLLCIKKIHKALCIESSPKETYGKGKNNTSTAVILTDYNGGGGVGDNGDGRASLTNWSKE